MVSKSPLNTGMDNDLSFRALALVLFSTSSQLLYSRIPSASYQLRCAVAFSHASTALEIVLAAWPHHPRLQLQQAGVRPNIVSVIEVSSRSLCEPGAGGYSPRQVVLLDLDYQ